MWSMNDSMAQADSAGIPLEMPAWRTALGWFAALSVALLFFVSGLWKITDPEGAAVRMAQARVPESLSLAAALGFGIVETVAAAMLVVPRLRRWGAVISALLLLAFLAWIGFHYAVLRGEECSCFPWLKRAVGPGFFIGDGLMLALALAAGILAPRPRGRGSVALIAGAVTVFAMVSWGVATVRQTGTRAPDTVLVDAQPYSLRNGKVLLFFFDPSCMHCFDAAQKMSTLHWNGTRVVGVPVSQPNYAPQFMIDTGMKMAITSDHAILKQIFPYTAVPAAVALENGRQTAQLVRFEGDEPAATLKRLRLVE
jgi:uncharacterized membrane protein YphA (DoxX/SURF4 family)